MQRDKKLHQIWAEQVARHVAEDNALLMNEINTYQNPLYESLGEVGRRLLKAFADTQCKQGVNIYSSARAAFIPYGVGGFLNRMVYGTDVLSDSDDLAMFGTRTHEITHALQFLVSAASHASIYNQNTKIVICPRDTVFLEELKETAAIAMDRLFRMLQQQQESGQGTLDSLIAMQGWLQDHASGVLDTVNRNSGRAEREYYRDKVLGNERRWIRGDFETMHQFRGKENIVFVRLEDEDKKALCRLLDLDFYYAGQYGIPPLTDEQEASLAKVNALWGIDEANLPVFGTALAQRSMTRETYIDCHRSGRAEPAPQGPVCCGPNATRQP